MIGKAKRVYRMASSHFRMDPCFFIIGAQKCATSSLYDFIAKHPAVKIAEQKEIHYFDMFYKKGFAWYKSHFPVYSKNCISGEATPNLFWSVKSLKILKDTFPEIKIIVALRDPMERALSHYYHNVRNGREKRNLYDALKAKESTTPSKKLDFLSPEYIKCMRFSYVSKSRYFEQLSYLESLYNLDNILFLKYSDIINLDKSTRVKIFNFLGVSDYNIKEMSYKNKGSIHNYSITSNEQKLLSEFLEEDKCSFLNKLGWENF